LKKCSAGFHFIIGLLLLVLIVAVTVFGDGAWVTKANMPTARKSMGVAAANGKIYAIGGYNTNYLNKVEEYDPVNDTWTTKANIPTTRTDLGAAEVNGKIYAIGGYNTQYQYGMSTVEEYDPVSDTWTSKANMPTARGSIATAVVNGKIYTIGGYTGLYSNKVEEFDPVANSWTTKANLPTARQSLVADVVDGKIYAIGGYSGTYLNKVEMYDPASNTWTTKANMPTARSAPGVAVLNGIIHVMGGYYYSTYPGVYYNLVETYDPVLNTWSTTANMPTARSGLRAVEVGGKIYAIGGKNDSNVFNKTEEYHVFNPPAVPTNVTATSTSSSVTVSWDAVTDATGYDVYADGTIIDNGAALTYAHTGLNAGSLHTYKVRAKNGAGASNWTAPLDKWTLLNTPNVSAAPTGATEITVSWGSVTNATGYDIEVDSTVNDNGTGASYVHSGLITGSQHQYRVKAKNANTASAWSTLVTQTTSLVTPSNVAVTATSTTVTVTWDLMSGTTGYDVEKDNTVIDNGTSTTFLDTGLQPCSQHTYRVRVRYPGGNSAWSSAVITFGLALAGEPMKGIAPLEVSLAVTVIPAQTQVASYEWDFNNDGVTDRTTTTGTSTYIFSQAGNNPVKVTAIDTVGTKVEAVATVEVLTANLAASPLSGPVPLAVNLSAVMGCPVTSFQWDFNNDGVIDRTTTSGITNYTYSQAGSYRARVVVTDPLGHTSEGLSQLIQAGTGSPISIDASVYPAEGVWPLTVAFNNNATSSAGVVTSFKWDFENDGVCDWETNAPGNVSHVYTRPGLYQAKLTVTDSKANTAEKIFAVNVLWDPTAKYIITPDNGGAPLNAKFTARAASMPDSAIYQWDFEGDGTFDWSSTVGLTTIMNQNAESGLQGWTAGGCWHIGLYGSQHIFYSSFTYYFNNSNDSLISPEIDLTNYLYPYLEFDHSYSVEAYYDFCLVEVSRDSGSTWETVKSYTGILNPPVTNGLNHEKISLQQYEGSHIKIRFRLFTDAQNYSSGWKLDNIKITSNSCVCNHVYTQPGTYSPVLKISDSYGYSYTNAGQVVVKTSGTPVATTAADTVKGPAPLTVNFHGTGSDPNGTITLYEWDFEGDGTYDWNSASSGDCSFTYNQPGVYNAKLRVTDSEEFTSESTVKIEADLVITLSTLAESFNPEQSQTLNIGYSLNGAAQVWIDIILRDGTLVKNLISNQSRPIGSNSEVWDGKDLSGSQVAKGVYYVVLRAETANGRECVLDLTDQSEELVPTSVTAPGNFTPTEDQFCDLSWYMPQRGLVTSYIIDKNYVTRLRTLSTKKPYLLGNAGLIWDGTDDAGLLLPADSYAIGLIAETLPVNAIILRVNEPVITSISFDPNYFNSEDNAYQLNPGRNNATINAVFDIASQITVKIRDKEGTVVKTITNSEYKTSHTIVWNGLDDLGENLDPGMYSAEITGKSVQGHESEALRASLLVFY
jgi:PKD repeat protein